MPEETVCVDLNKFFVQSYHLDTFCLTVALGVRYKVYKARGV